MGAQSRCRCCPVTKSASARKPFFLSIWNKRGKRPHNSQPMAAMRHAGKVCPRLPGNAFAADARPSYRDLTPLPDLGTEVMHKLWQGDSDRLNFAAESMI